MRHDLLPRLVCPSCRSGLRLQAWDADARRVRSGYLQCPTCAIVTPVIEGFVLFTETLLHPGQATPAALAELAERLFGSADDFQRLLRTRRQRGSCEVYAAFQPFNEAMRVIEPLLPWLRPRIPASGGAIVDLWCRTGWSAQWLAGCFPDTPVVALWEGAHSVLGYKGWQHLIGLHQRRDNLDVVFADPRQPLPFANGAFALSYSHDILHRYGWQPLAGESLRITAADGALLHSHLHLSNSEPEPYFARGCQQQHGRDWRAWLDGVEAASRAAGTPRRGYVFGETTMFTAAAPAPLDDAPDTPDYNGLLLILPAGAEADHAAADPLAPWAAGCRQLLNPLLRGSTAASEARVHPAALGSGVAELLRQHPLLAGRLPHRGLRLERADWTLLTLTAAGLDGAALRPCCSDPADAAARLARLQRHELLRPVPVDRASLQLQAVHALLDDAPNFPDADQHTCRQRLQRWLDGWARAGERIVLALDDGDGLDGPGARMLFDAMQRWLGRAAAAGTLVLRGRHPLADLLALAAALAGWSLHWQDETAAPAVHGLPGPSGEADTRGWPLGADGEPDGLLAHLLMHAESAEPATSPLPQPALKLQLDAAVALPADGVQAPLKHWLSGSLRLNAWLLPGERSSERSLPTWLLSWGRWQADAQQQQRQQAAALKP